MIVRAGISKSFINKKQRWTNSPDHVLIHTHLFEKLSEEFALFSFESVLKFLMCIIFHLLRLDMLTITEKRLSHMCLIKVCAYKYVHAYMTVCTDGNVLGKNVSARVHVCIRE